MKTTKTPPTYRFVKLHFLHDLTTTCWVFVDLFFGVFVLYHIGVTQGKLQKHQAFEAEVQANAGAIIKLDETGNLMISEGHFASETIRVSHTMMKLQPLSSAYFLWIDDLIHLIQSYTPYRTQQRPIVTSVNMAEYIQVGLSCYGQCVTRLLLRKFF